MDLSNQFRNLKIYIDKIRRSIRFINLLDTPDSYDGKAGYFPKVNTTEDGLELVSVTPGSYSWNMVDNEDVTTVIADGTSVKFEDSDDIDLTVTVDTETPYIHTIKAELKAGVVHTQLHEMDSTSDHKGNVSSLFLTPATPDDTTGHTAVTALSYASVTDGAVLKKYTDGSSNPAMKLEKVKISECTSTTANCMFVSNSSGGITEFGVGATGTILKGNGITSDPSFGTLSTLTRGTGLTGSNYAGFTDTTWAVNFAGTGSATTVSRSDHTHTDLHTRLHAMSSVTDHYASGNKMFCSLDIGGGSTATISEFSLGTSGTFLKSTGVSTVPAFSQIVPSDIQSVNQYRIFASDNTQIVQEIAMGNGDAFLISNGTTALPGWVTPSVGYMKYTAEGYSFVNETYSLSTHNHSGVYATADHTHSQLHNRSHAVTSTSDHTGTAYRTLYVSSTGYINELSHGSNGALYMSQGASSDPCWVAPSGYGYLKWTAEGYINVSNVMINPMTTAGDIIYGGTSGTPTRLGQSLGYLYCNGSSALSWVNGGLLPAATSSDALKTIYVNSSGVYSLNDYLTIDNASSALTVAVTPAASKDTYLKLVSYSTTKSAALSFYNSTTETPWKFGLIYADSAQYFGLRDTTSSQEGWAFRVDHSGATTRIGFYGASPTARASAISSPSADVSSLKTAVDAIRTALQNIGITN